MALYEPDRHHAQTFRYGGHDCGVCAFAHAGLSSLNLGHVERAREQVMAGVALAAELGHGTTRPVAQWNLTRVLVLLRDSKAVLESANTTIDLCSRFGPAHFGAAAMLIRGWAIASDGAPVEGLEEAERGLVAYEATGAGLRFPFYLMLLADAYRLNLQTEDGLSTVSRALDVVKQKGERDSEAELQRLKGLLLRQTAAGGAVDSEDEAQQSLELAVRIAADQGAEFLRLRACRDLAQLHRDHGDRRRARDLLNPVVARFAKGQETADLQEAKALLDDLSSKLGE